MNNKSDAEIVLELYRKRDNADKIVLMDNIFRILTKKYPKCANRTARVDKLVELTRLTRHTVLAWSNKSRSDVKIPLPVLCEIAIALDIDVHELFK